MYKNRIRGDGEQGEQAKDCEALVTQSSVDVNLAVVR
jgi:hypothetical protein